MTIPAKILAKIALGLALNTALIGALPARVAMARPQPTAPQVVAQYCVPADDYPDADLLYC
jgi:hypothetical protein